MGPVGSPTLHAHKLLQHNVASIRERLESVRTEAVTGRAADVARAVGGDTAKVNRLTQSIDYAEGRATALEFEGSRAKAVQGALTDVRNNLSGTQEAVLLGLSEMAPRSLETAAALGASGFDNAVSRLNGGFAGRPMFGGDSGSAPLSGADEIMDQLRAVVAAAPDTATALAEVDSFFNDPAGGFSTAVYQGGAGDAPSIELSKSERISTGIRADDAALRDTLRGFALTALSADATTLEDKRAFLSAGNAAIGSAASGTIELQSQLGVREERIATAQSAYQGEIASLSISYNGLTGRDQAEAVTEMRLLESQLEAAYLTTSRLAGLSLTNFLR